MRILQLGCGGVGICVVNMLSQLPNFDMEQLTIVDQAESVYNAPAITRALKEGATVVIKKIDRGNWREVLGSHLSASDLLLDLSFGISTIDLLTWCQENSVLYINTAIEKWEDELIIENGLSLSDPHNNEKGWTKMHKDLYERTLYARHMQIMKKGFPADGPTSVLEHGCNPGLVSHFVRAALDDIVTSLLEGAHQFPPSPSLDALGTLLSCGHYPQIAQLLGLKVVHISEIDTQVSSRQRAPGEFVNTWSPMGFAEEALDWVQVGWGTHEREPPCALTPEGDKHQIFIPMHAMDLRLHSYVPDCSIVGMCIPHGESESLARYFTVRQDTHEDALCDEQGNLRLTKEDLYRPSIYYVYQCADIADQSLQEMRENGYVPQSEYEVLTQKHNLVGEDRVGCLLLFDNHPFKTVFPQMNGKEKKPWAYWYGSILGTHNNPIEYCNPTVVQVASSVVAALQWALDNPNKGICWPEMLPHKEILAKAQGPHKYLGEIVSRPVNYFPPPSLQFVDFVCGGMPF